MPLVGLATLQLNQRLGLQQGSGLQSSAEHETWILS
jgi:hypothetical protein